MSGERIIEGGNAPDVPLFILSPLHAAELAGIAERDGWRIAEQPEPGAIVTVDARDGLEPALAWIAWAAEQARAVLVLVAREEAAALDRAQAAGATDFLTMPAGCEEVRHALRFAARAAERRDRSRRRDDPETSWPPHWVGPVRDWVEARLASGRTLVAVQASFARFDIVNAAHGRQTGDAILAVTAARLSRVAAELFGANGLATRASGAEFVLVGDAEDADADRAAAAVARALAPPFDGVVLGCRVGSAQSLPGDDAVTLLHRAADAMRRAREGGWVLRAAEAEASVSSDMLAVDLHHALARGEVTLLFQPQAEVATGRIVGVEALARWDHPRLGALGADALFAAAERAGLGVPLSDHIQKLVLERAAAWPGSLSHLRVALNLTAADVGRPDFAGLFLSRVRRSGFPPERLTAELTETGLIADLDATARLLAALRTAGCRTAIDDFGTGYSSLAYLQSLPVDYLKLDRALVQQPGDRTVVAGVLAMARSLGIATIAEGVETKEQLHRLAEEGCDLYQGYLCAGALDEPALTRLVETGDAC